MPIFVNMEVAQKYRLVEKIIHTDDEALLREVEELLGLASEDFWYDLPSHVQQNINKAKEELDNGLGLKHEYVWSQIEKRFL